MKMRRTSEFLGSPSLQHNRRWRRHTPVEMPERHLRLFGLNGDNRRRIALVGKGIQLPDFRRRALRRIQHQMCASGAKVVIERPSTTVNVVGKAT